MRRNADDIGQILTKDLLDGKLKVSLRLTTSTRIPRIQNFGAIAIVGLVRALGLRRLKSMRFRRFRLCIH